MKSRYILLLSSIVMAIVFALGSLYFKSNNISVYLPPSLYTVKSIVAKHAGEPAPNDISCDSAHCNAVTSWYVAGWPLPYAQADPTGISEISITAYPLAFITNVAIFGLIVLTLLSIITMLLQKRRHHS